MTHSNTELPVTEGADKTYYADARTSSPAAMARLDRAIRSLVGALTPRHGMKAAADARDAARSLAGTLGAHEVPFRSVERRIEALVRLDVPHAGGGMVGRRRLLREQLMLWASEAYHEARARLRRPADLS